MRGQTSDARLSGSVADAERLDALGAIGILRCASACRTTLYERHGHGRSTHDDDVSSGAEDDQPFGSGTAAARIADLGRHVSRMHTHRGRELAQKRVATIESFLHQLRREMEDA